MRTESSFKKDFNRVEPVVPPAPYLGGKRLLAKTIVPLIENIPHRLYAEPFVGMGGVFFRRGLVPKAEVINDINKEIINLFRIFARFPAYLADMFRYKIYSRAEFEAMLEQPPELLTDLERAARFLYLQKAAFGGKVSGQTFGIGMDGARLDCGKVCQHVDLLHERLKGVIIECLPYQQLIARYDREFTLFYLDPPYWDSEKVYGKGVFGKEDFARLAEILSGIKGKFVMSVNDVPEIREIFGRFCIKEVETTYSIGKSTGKKAGELLVSNVKLKELISD